MGYIYKIENTINNKIYIGCTIQDDVKKRWSLHKRLAKKDKGCTALKSAFKKYGVDNFKFEIIIICFNEDCFKFEKEYIKKYNTLVPNGYNISEGGGGGALFKGHHHTEETKTLLREKSKEYYRNPENRNNLGKKVKDGLQKSEKWQKAFKEGRIGENLKKGNRSLWQNKTSMTEEVKNKISESLHKYYEKNKGINIEKHNKLMSEKLGKQVGQYDLNKNYIKTYLSFAEAGRQTGIPRTSIMSCASGKLKTAGGFIWRKIEKASKEIDL
jgi:group I intron endonuclease